MTEDYSLVKNNTVSSSGQLKDTPSVRFYNPNGSGKRIMFVGNSITLHGILPEIGWERECGMAASSAEKDYVHLLMDKTEALCPDSAYCICQVAEWEREYYLGEEKHAPYRNASLFGADVIILRFIENCPADGFDSRIFKENLAKLVSFLDPALKARIIVTTGFWRHPGDRTLEEFAAENAFPCVLLGDLGEKDEMKAPGLFWHAGVAAHPGDLGMEHIAERIFTELEKVL
ncbi:MAG: SGNH/GDSL hydrolase family protein [Clostridia bacterium]|nr:SGNH/GDSL hydrolase family protein [Clostridia bacterium]